MLSLFSLLHLHIHGPLEVFSSYFEEGSLLSFEKKKIGGWIDDDNQAMCPIIIVTCPFRRLQVQCNIVSQLFFPLVFTIYLVFYESLITIRNSSSHSLGLKAHHNVNGNRAEQTNILLVEL